MKGKHSVLARNMCLAGLTALAIVFAGASRSAGQPPSSSGGAAPPAVQKARELYVQAEFQQTIDCLQEFCRAQPKHKEAQSLLTMARQQLTTRKQMEEVIASSTIDRQQYVAARYQRALADFNKGEHSEALKGFRTVWILAGSYQDTWDYLQKSSQLANGPSTSSDSSKATKSGDKDDKEGDAKAKQIDDLLKTGASQYQLKKYDEAKITYTNILALDSKNSTAKKQLKKIDADVEREAKEKKEREDEAAAKEREAAAKKREADIEQLNVQGAAALKKKDYDAAIKIYGEAVSKKSDSFWRRRAASKGLAKAQAEKEKTQKAAQRAELEAKEKERERQEAAKEKEVERLLNEAKLAMNKKDYAAAAALYQQVQQKDATNKDARKGLANVEEEKAKSQKAAKDAELKSKEDERKRQAAAEQKEIDGLLKDAQTAMNKKDYAAAAALYQQVRQKDAANKDARKGLERVQKALDEQAKNQKSPAEIAREKKIEELLAQGDALMAEKKYAEARDRYQLILNEDTQNRAARDRLEKVNNIISDEDRRAATAAANAADDKNTREKEAAESARKAEADRIKREKEAAENARKAEADNNKQVSDLVAQAQKQYQKDNFGEALQLLGQALALDPDNAAAKDLKTKCDRGQEQEQERKAAAAAAEQRQREEKQRRLDAAKEVDALNRKTKNLLAQRDFDAAKAANEEALALDMENREAQNLRKTIAKTQTETQAELIEAKIAEAKRSYRNKDYETAVSLLEDFMIKHGSNADASRLLGQARTELDKQKAAAAKSQTLATQDSATALFSKGIEAHDLGDLEAAVGYWRQALEVMPDYARAQVQLDETKEEYAEYLAKKAATAQQRQIEEKILASLKEKVPGYSSNGPQPLREMLENFSILTDIQYVIAQDIKATINVKFENKSVEEMLNATLKPNGLIWSRNNDIITITKDLTSRVFPLTAENLPKVKNMMEKEWIQRVLWGDADSGQGKIAGEPSVEGTQLILDERAYQLFIHDSLENIQKLEKLIEESNAETPVQLEMKEFRIAPGLGPKIKTVLEAVLETRRSTDMTFGPKIYLFDEILIVKGTREDIQRAEDIMVQEEWISMIGDDTLEVQVFDLTPHELIRAEPVLLTEYIRRVKEVVRTILYSQSTVSGARDVGRKMWFDENLYQMTIVDYPSNLRRVADYVAALVEISRKERRQIKFMEFAAADDVKSRVDTYLGIQTSTNGASNEGRSVTRSLSVEDAFTFGDLTIRLVRVEENDFQDENDDSIELVINTPTGSEEVTLEEFRSENVDDYLITAEEIDPSTSRPGEGRARITITDVGAADEAAPPDEPAPEPAAPPVDLGVTVEPISDLNALLITYTDPSLYAEVLDAIEIFDRPVKQALIQTKLVEVDDVRAKMVANELDIINLGHGSPSLSNFSADGGFAQDAMELSGSIYEPPIEYAEGAQLLKGWSIYNVIFSGDSPVEMQLRMFEAEGIVTTVNGPRVLVMNNGSAEFTIGRGRGGGNFGGGGFNQFNQGGNFNQFNQGGGGFGGGFDPFGGGFGGGFNNNQFGGGGFNNNQFGGGGFNNNQFGNQGADRVDMEISTINITEAGNITLEMDITLSDPVRDIGNLQFGGAGGGGGGVQQAANPRWGDGWGVRNQGSLDTSERTLETTARVADGGTIVLGGWVSERHRDLTSGVPMLRNLPYIGPMFFGRSLRSLDRVTLLIFLTAEIQP